MTAEVVELIQPPAANNVVEVLEAALAQARGGKVIAVAVSYVDDSGDLDASLGINNYASTALLLAAITLTQAEMIDLMQSAG